MDQLKRSRCFRMGMLGKGLAVLLCIGVMGAAVMLLWNWLMPSLIPGVQELTFWRALGLLVLCRILFGGFRGKHHWQEKKRRIRARWEGMTPEERERFQSHFQSRFGMFGCRNGRPNGNGNGNPASRPEQE